VSSSRSIQQAQKDHNNASEEPNTSTTVAIWRRFRRNKLALFGAALLVLLAFTAVFAGIITPHDPIKPFETETGALRVWAPPSAQHLLGTDQLGRDVLSRLIYGGRVSLTVGLVSMGIATTVGTLLGAFAGYFGGTIDNIIMRITDTVLCFPIMFLVISASAMLEPSIYNVMAVIGLVSWTHTCRLVRGEFLKLKEQEFVQAARAIGRESRGIIFRHVLPNALAPVLVAATLGVGSAILTEAALSWLGVGVQQPIPSWGNMLQEASSLTVLATKPWLWLPPGLCILLAVLSINFLGDGLRDAVDPKQGR